MINWVCKEFASLSSFELYAILQLRNEVFVVEQHCVYQDADNKDISANHLMGWQNGKLVAYTRLIPAGIAYAEPSIGRVVTSPAARKSGLGRQLMNESINECRKLFGVHTIRIGAQLYLQQFYHSLGFIPNGGIYLEDGIEHIEMLLS